MPPGLVASTPGLPRNPAEARDQLAAEGVTFDGARASERCRCTIEQWRAAGCPSGTEAVAINRAIIARSPQDIPAHNRLGRAYQNLGLPEDARDAFEMVVRLDPGNAIATKRLREISRPERGYERQG